MYDLYDCDLCETKHSGFLLSAGVCLMEVSGIAYQGWSLMKIATVLKVLGLFGGAPAAPALGTVAVL